MKRTTYLKIGLWLMATFAAPRYGLAQETHYRHQVTQGETLYSISNKYGVTIEDLKACNPSLTAENLKAGTTLVLPATLSPAGPAGIHCRTMHKVGKKETLWSIATQYEITVDELLTANPDLSSADAKIKKGSFLCIPYAQAEKVVAPAAPVGYKHLKIAIVLPLLSNRVEARRSIEFYRGFLMAVEQMKRRGIDIDITTLNEPAAEATLSSLQPRLNASEAQLVIGPLYPGHFEEMARFVTKMPDARWLIPFSSKYNSITEAKPFLLNAPEEVRAEKLSELFLRIFGHAKVVFLTTSADGGTSLFAPLRQALQLAGCAVASLPDNATVSQMQGVAAPTGYTVFLPENTTAETAERVARQVSELRRAAQGDSKIALFGYADWLQLKGTARALLFEADTYIYTADFFNPYIEQTKSFNDTYQQWFHTPILERIPALAPLGYDAGLYMMSGLATYGKDFSTQEISSAHYQSALHFKKQKGGDAYVNDCTYLIHYAPDCIIHKISAQ